MCMSNVAVNCEVYHLCISSLNFVPIHSPSCDIVGIALVCASYDHVLDRKELSRGNKNLLEVHSRCVLLGNVLGCGSENRLFTHMFWWLTSGFGKQMLAA